MRIFYAIYFIFLYLWEVILSTWNLMCWVMKRDVNPQSCFVDVPLTLRGDFPRFLFACLVSMTPGSLSVALDPDRGVLCVHLLDAPDQGAAIAEMKSRIEAPLLRVFPNRHA
ncbi:MAG: hypothetical protein EAZ42_02985 [Verrucomicrobia bacterium]|nr:MAG: hypothetical protein EAZ42_02985 [Verrucomicrobiota bacterium]